MVQFLLYFFIAIFIYIQLEVKIAIHNATKLNLYEIWNKCSIEKNPTN